MIRMHLFAVVVLALACSASTDDGLTLIIDGEEQAHDRTLVTAYRDGLRLTLSDPGERDIADEGWAATLVVEFEPGVLSELSEPRSLTIAGDATFVMPDSMGVPTYTYTYPEEDILFAPREGHSAEIRRAWVTYSCFCTGYRDVVQPLTGTLLLEASGDEVHAQIDLEASALPFWGAGFETSVESSLTGPFTFELE